MLEIIFAIVCVVLAIISLIISVMSFKEKGFLFNNAYIWTSKQERKTMNKKPYYWQTAIAFTMITAVFLCTTIECILSTGWLWIVVGGICFILLVCAIKSSIKKI